MYLTKISQQLYFFPTYYYFLDILLLSTGISVPSTEDFFTTLGIPIY